VRRSRAFRTGDPSWRLAQLDLAQLDSYYPPSSMWVNPNPVFFCEQVRRSRAFRIGGPSWRLARLDGYYPPFPM